MQIHRRIGKVKDTEIENKNIVFFFRFLDSIKKDIRVDATVIDSWQHKLDQMVDFPPLLTSAFDLYKCDVSQIKAHIMWHALIQSVNKFFRTHTYE